MMLRRFTSILVILVTLMSFFVSTSFVQAESIQKKKPAKKEHVMKKKAHKVKKSGNGKKKHKTGKKSHKMKKKVKVEKEDSRIKVN